MTVAALGTVDASHSGMASGVNNTARQIGIAAGIAGFGAVLPAGIADGVRPGWPRRGPRPIAQRPEGSPPRGVARRAVDALGAAGGRCRRVRHGVHRALHTVFVLRSASPRSVR